MIISFLRNEINISRLCIEAMPLELVASFKILGIMLDNRCKWEVNRYAIMKKASKRLYITRVLWRCGHSSGDLLSLLFFGKIYPRIRLSRLAYHTTCIPV